MAELDPIAGWVEPWPSGPCGGFEGDGRSSRCSRCDWNDSDHGRVSVPTDQHDRSTAFLELVRTFATSEDGEDLAAATFRLMHAHDELLAAKALYRRCKIFLAVWGFLLCLVVAVLLANLLVAQ